MLPADLRITGADVVVTRHVARSYRIDIADHTGAPVPVGSVAWWIGGTADGGDNQGDAAEYAAAPVAGGPPSASWTLSVPALTDTRALRLRWVINGKVAAVGTLSAQRDGQPSPADTIAVVVDEAHIALRLEGLPGDTTAADELAQQAAQSASDAWGAVLLNRGRWPVMQIALNDTDDPSIQDQTTLDPITKDTYIHGDYTITATDGGVLHEGGIRLRGRGNSTWSRPKKPWRINFDQATAPLGLTAVQRNWALMADDFDASKINYGIGLDLGARMSGLVWTPEWCYVELVLNGSYRGIYRLQDLVRMESGRVEGEPPTEDGDGSDGTWLVEVTNKETEQEPGFYTSVLGNWVIYDDPEDLTETQEQYILDAFDAFEQAVVDGDWDGWKLLADATSMADWYLVSETLRNNDSWNLFSSVKMTKAPDDGSTVGKLSMGPLWDMDLTFGNTATSAISSATTWHTRNGGNTWFGRMWDDADFRLLLQSRWLALLDAIGDLGGVGPMIDRTVDALTRAIADDDRRWTRTTYLALEADRRKRWLADRIAWMDPQIMADPNPVTELVSETV